MKLFHTIRAALLAVILSSFALPALAINGNISAFGPPINWVPSLAGQTDNPAATYTTDTGRYYILGNIVFFNFNIVTSGTTTKTTTTDNFAVTLPVTAATSSGEVQYVTCNVQNATPITVGTVGVIASGGTQMTFLGLNSTTVTNLQTMTWATTNPGIGVLSHVITAECSGWYESSF